MPQRRLGSKKIRALSRSRSDPSQKPFLPFDTDMYRMLYDSKGSLGKEIVPRLVQEYIPFSIIKSISLAIDPFKKFRVAPNKISPVNRTRKRTINSVTQDRKTVLRKVSTVRNYGPQQLLACKPYSDGSTLSTVTTTTLAKQASYVMETKDTTSRTRPKQCDYGEFEKFEYSIASPDRSFAYYDHGLTSTYNFTCQAYQYTDGIDRFWRSIEGDAATLTSAQIDGIAAAEKTALASEMQKKALGMLPKVVPGRRQYTLFRNVAELRDIPRSIASLRETCRDFARLFASGSSNSRWVYDLSNNVKNIPKEFVSYSFGWRQLWSDIQGALASPARITRDVNRLIERRLKPTTFRLKQKYALDSLIGPDFSYNTESREVNVALATKRDRQIELRLAVNAIFDFPTLGIPTLRQDQDQFFRRFGVYPTATDIYNLVPWSWLVDWFTGLGNYVEAIDVINSDSTLFNMGFLTGTLTGKLSTTRTADVISTDYAWQVGTPFAGYTNIKQSYSHTSVLDYKLISRRDIVNAYGAKVILTDASLSTYQRSILGAILLERAGLLKKK